MKLSTFIIIVFVILIVVGILFGWFRKKTNLTKEELDQIKDVHFTNTNQSTDIFYKLWNDHVDLTRQFILADLHNKPELQDVTDKLLKNQEDIAHAVDIYYVGSYELIVKLLKEHILIAKDIVEDLKYKRVARTPSDINRWYENADVFSEAMNKINPKWNLYSHMNRHLKITEEEVLAEFSGLQKLSLDIYNNKIVPQSQEIAKSIISGIQTK